MRTPARVGPGGAARRVRRAAPHAGRPAEAATLRLLRAVRNAPMDRRKACVSASVLLISSEKICARTGVGTRWFSHARGSAATRRQAARRQSHLGARQHGKRRVGAQRLAQPHGNGRLARARRARQQYAAAGELALAHHRCGGRGEAGSAVGGALARRRGALLLPRLQLHSALGAEREAAEPRARCAHAPATTPAARRARAWPTRPWLLYRGVRSSCSPNPRTLQRGRAGARVAGAAKHARGEAARAARRRPRGESAAARNAALTGCAGQCAPAASHP